MKTTSLTAHPHIIEDENTRTLRFGTWGIQSRMHKRAPNELALGYTQAMMAFLLLQPAPQDILIVGLGGGSLSKYCYHRLRHCRVTTIEVNRDVIDLREQFRIPEDGARFKVIHDDAAQYLQGQTGIADIILLDGYDNFGIPPALSSSAFYRDCHSALREDGILVANISGSNAQTGAYLKRIETTFTRQVLKARSVTGHNDIAFGLKNPEGHDMKILRSRASTLHAETGIDFSRYLDQMWLSACTWFGVGHPTASARAEEQA